MQQSSKTFWAGIIKQSGGKLDMVDRINEVIFGLIMVLTFTCTMNAATGGGEEVRDVLWAALACNVAWGVIDAFIYIFSVMMYRGEALDTLQQVRSAKSESEARDALHDSLPLLINDMMKPEHYSYLTSEIQKLPAPPSKTIFTWSDFLGAVKIFFLVFISTFPVTIPFFFIEDVMIAVRVSNGIALVLLFITGFYFGRRTRYLPMLTGLMVMGIGVLLVAMTIALGG